MNAQTPLMPTGNSKPSPLVSLTGSPSFAVMTMALQIILLVLFKLLANIDSPTQDDQYYNLLVGVELMMLVGFGYLMAFLRWYGLGSAGLTLYITCLGTEVSLFSEALFADWFKTQVKVNYRTLIDANFAVAAFLISFGGLIGKVNPSQLCVMTVFESLFYGFNKRIILTKWFDIQDAGGTIIIHMFGAIFGLAASRAIGKPTDTTHEKASYISDIFSLIGTVFLWLYWPSFVSASLKPGTIDAQRAVINTIVALLGSTVVTFGLSPLFTKGKLDPVHIQNSTLAGGVAIGATANFPLGPFGALLIGSVAGAISVFGFARVTPFLLERFDIHDSCGIGNLHGMPSIFGGLASAIVPIWIDTAGSPYRQVLGVAFTLLVGGIAGFYTGKVMNLFKDDRIPMAVDGPYWEVADDFEIGESARTIAQS